jgi:CheY-like chemotaxis protein
MTSRDITVLAVDDQPQNIRLLDAVLSPRGYTVVPATGGEEALAVLDERSVDLVLLDVLMPGMDGYEVCRRIRAAPRTLTAVADSAEEAPTMFGGARQVLVAEARTALGEAALV